MTRVAGEIASRVLHPINEGDEPLLISLDFRCPITAVYEERELG